MTNFRQRLESVWGGGEETDVRSWETAEELIDSYEGLETSERDILQTRWVDEAMLYHNLWKRQRFAYYMLRVPMVIGATTVPVLASLNVSKIATVLVGLAVAVLTALDGLFGLGRRWRQARFAEEKLGSEGWRFLGHTGKTYEKIGRGKDAYKVFLDRLEKLNEQLSMMRLELFDEKGQDPNHQ